jgi:acyl carrier protein
MSRERDYSLVKITPAHLDLLAEQLRDTEIEGRARALVIGGEELSPKGLRSWQERAAGTRLINEYGPTETVVGCSVYEVKKEDSLRGAVPIGRPIANTQMYVLDSELEPAPIGITGEIYISGAGLARGYAKRPELTAEKFIPSPFGGKGGERLYRTGDLGKYLSDGNIEFAGRTDDQVKVRGYRIELGEIEAILRESPEVIEAAVVIREGKDREKRLIAYLVIRNETVLDQAELRGFLRERLPDYMAPSAFVVLERLPLTLNGKIDRKNLPDPQNVNSPVSATYVAPQTELEQAIAAVWQELLQVNQVGIHDNFFDLGAHSLMMVQASSKLQDLLQRETPVLKLFQYPTISALAAHLNQGQGNVLAFTRQGALGQTGDGTENNGRSTIRLKRPIDIAIIGMSGRFPQAPTIDVFWRNLREAREAISPLSDSEILAAGVAPR